MVATAATLSIKDGAAASKDMRVVDESGAASGPYRSIMAVQPTGDLDSALWAYAAASGGILNTTTAVTFKAAAAAGIRNYITSIQIMAEALGTATELAIRDGAGGAVLWRIKIGTGGQSLINIDFPQPIKGSAATLLEVVTLTASGTGAVYFNAQGYIA
jgi:hypothetical protein